MKTHIIISILIFISFYGWTQELPAYSFEKELEIKEPLKLKVTTFDGYVKVNGSNESIATIYFTVKKAGKEIRISQKELERYVTIDILNKNNEVEVVVQQTEEQKHLSWKERYYVSLDVLSPQHTSCNIQTSDGDISLSKLNGNQLCKTSDGDIFIKNISGRVDGRTSDGDITCLTINGNTDLKTSDGHIIVEDIIGMCNLSTSDGDIRIRNVENSVSARTSDGDIIVGNLNGSSEFNTSDGNISIVDSKGRMVAHTSDGDVIFNNLLGGIVATTSDGTIQGDIDKLESDVSLKTVDGNVLCILPAGVGLDLYLKAESINTDLRNFTGNSSKHLIEGQMSGGGIRTEITSYDGDITLKYE